MDKFVARENIRHFRDRLETEADPTARSVLRKLLIQEEDKLGYNCEALSEIDNYIVHAKEHVRRQQGFLVSAQANGHDKAQAVILLEAYSETLRAFENQREKIATRIEHSRL